MRQTTLENSLFHKSNAGMQVPAINQPHRAIASFNLDQLHTWSREGEAPSTNQESKGDTVLAAGVEGQAGHGPAPLPAHPRGWDTELPWSQRPPCTSTESSQVLERPCGRVGTGGDHRVQRLAVG